MDGHILDFPARAALTSRHRALGEFAKGAMRYRPSIVPFAALEAPDDGALAGLVAPGETVVFLQVEQVETPQGFTVGLRDRVVQMVADSAPAPRDEAITLTRLTPEDAPDMLALAEQTRPGPFTLRAQELGTFYGLRQNGRLVAMAGVRMAVPGFTELSGVCTAPEARGLGLARALSQRVLSDIMAAGDQAFLHAWVSNHAAISLYETLGFKVRRDLHVAMFRRKDT